MAAPEGYLENEKLSVDANVTDLLRLYSVARERLSVCLKHAESLSQTRFICNDLTKPTFR